MKKNNPFKKNKDGSFVLTINITKDQLEKQKTKTLKLFTSTLEMEGFRKGQVPLKIAKTKIDEAELTNQSIQEILNQTYADLIKEQSLKPILPPKVKVLPSKDKKSEDIVVEIKSCEKPKLTLKKYQEEIKSFNAKKKIWTPGQEEKKEGEEDNQGKEEHLQKVLAILVRLSEIIMPRFLIEEETNRKLSRLIDQTQQLGMTLEDYFRSKNTNLETFKSEFQKQLENEWKINLILEKVADDLKVVITPEEIEKGIPEKGKKTADRYLLAKILRQRKTIEKLTQI